MIRRITPPMTHLMQSLKAGGQEDKRSNIRRMWRKGHFLTQLRHEVMGSILSLALPRHLKPSNPKKGPVNCFIKTMATTIEANFEADSLLQMKTPQPPSLICRTPNKNAGMTFTNSFKTRSP